MIKSAIAQDNLTVKSAIELSKKNNPYFSAEKLNIDISQADIITAKLRPNPTFNISVSQLTSHSYFAENTGMLNSANRQSMIQVGKVLQIKKLRDFKVNFAESNYTQSKLVLKDFEQNLIFQTTQEWLEVWYANIKNNILLQAKKNSDTLISINRIRLKNQVISTTELMRTEIEGEKYTLLIKSAEQELNNQIQGLKLILGINVDYKIDITDSVMKLKLSSSYDSLLNYTIKNNTAIILTQGLVNVNKQSYQLQKALANPLPEVGINYSAQNQAPYIGAYIAIPLPFSDRNQGEIEKAKIMTYQADTLVSATIREAKLNLMSAYNTYLNNKNVFDQYKNIYSKSEKVLSTLKITYIKGGTTFIDYLEAERNWFDMQNSYFEAYYNYQKSYLNLLNVSGLINNL